MFDRHAGLILCDRRGIECWVTLRDDVTEAIVGLQCRVFTGAGREFSLAVDGRKLFPSEHSGKSDGLEYSAEPDSKSPRSCVDLRMNVRKLHPSPSMCFVGIGNGVATADTDKYVVELVLDELI